MTARGSEYAGALSKTLSGRKCLKWKDLSSHAISIKDADRFPDDSLDGAFSYCRNPDRKPGGPWCYYDDKPSSWEHCNLLLCSGCIMFAMLL